MNRAERRRQQRAEARKKVPVVIVGDGIVATEIPGFTFEGHPRRDLPVKIPGSHRWIATAGYVVTNIDVQRAYDEDHHTYLDQENLFTLAIGCYDCERPLGVIQPGSTCPAEGDE